MKDRTIPWDGKQISRPGLYKNVPLSAYHDADICVGPSISSSGLRKLFATSPAHFYAQWQGNPRRVEPEDKRHFVLGRALHHLVLGEPFFAKLFCIQPHEWPDERGVLMPWNNNRKVCRAWNAARRKEGRSPLTPTEVEQIKQMSVSVANHPLVKAGALNGQIERSMFWQDEETGIWLKARPDTIPTDSAVYVDLKTTYSVLFVDLLRIMREHGYWQQAALVDEGSRKVLRMPMESFTLIFVEKREPWCTRDVRVDQNDILRGRRANRAALRTFAKCLEERHWPGPGEGNEGNERLPLTAAAREQIDEKLKYEGLADGED